MSCLQNELILESLFEEVQEAFPYLSEEKQIEIHEPELDYPKLHRFIKSENGYIS